MSPPAVVTPSDAAAALDPHPDTGLRRTTAAANNGVAVVTPTATAATATTTTCENRRVDNDDDDDDDIADFVIVGAGIVGLVLALALQGHGVHHRHNSKDGRRNSPPCKIEIYEQSKQFRDGVGGGIGMYPNGLRVIRDISQGLLQQIRTEGYPYLFRRWERHDGTEVMVAEESVLASEPDLQPLGIRRWKLQKVLHNAALADGNIQIHFAKRIQTIEHHKPSTTSTSTNGNGNNHHGDYIELFFEDGTTRKTRLLFAADGAKSPTREAVLNLEYEQRIEQHEQLKLQQQQQQQQHENGKAQSNKNEKDEDKIAPVPQLQYTGTTCLYGVAPIGRDQRGICFPSSETSKCHGAFFAVSPNEQCFQFHFPTPAQDQGTAVDKSGGWTALLKSVGQEECRKLADRMKADGWDEDKYLKALYHKDVQAIKVPFALLDPPLESFVYCNDAVVLLGDAAHPPVPYLGQGAQQGIEDAGTLAVLLREMCCCSDSDTNQGHLSFRNIKNALKLYNQLRVPRTAEIIERSKWMGQMQQKRAENHRYNCVKEELIKRSVFFHETHSEIVPGVTYDYKHEIERVLHEQFPLMPVPEETAENGEEDASTAATPAEFDKEDSSSMREVMVEPHLIEC